MQVIDSKWYEKFWFRGTKNREAK